MYFPDAAQDVDAGPMADENVVVLNPEWLAKAVGFVIEDQATVTAQGILDHRLLSNILEKRREYVTAPVMQASLWGYLLWLMWKFDIETSPNDTSLVPELIARNRIRRSALEPRHTIPKPRGSGGVCIYLATNRGK